MFSGLDLKTIVVCNGVLTGLLALALIFVRAHQKTYPGFDAWVWATVAVTFGYVALLSHVRGPDVVSSFLAPGIFTLAAMLRLDATRRFLDGKRLPRGLYLFVPFVIGGCAVIYYYWNGMALRNLLFSGVLAGVAFIIAWRFARHAKASRLSLYRAIASVMAAFGFMILLRAGLWCAHPEVGLFTAGDFHAGYMLGAALSEVVNALVFLAVNNQRLEEDLTRSQRELSAKLAEIKVLSGLLRICAGCKRIHNDDDQWEQMEAYVHRHSDAQFTHGICPDCANRLYPDFVKQLR